MERINKLKSLFETLNCDYSLDGEGMTDAAFLILMHLKVTIFISKNLYENKRPYPEIVAGEYSGLLYEGYPIEDDFDYINQSKLTCSYLPDYVLAYMDKSPFWDYRVTGLYVDDDEYVIKDEKGHGSVDEKYIRFIYGDFLEEEVFKNRELLDKVTDFYAVGYDYTDDLCVIKSQLYPYLDEFRKAAKEEYPMEIECLEDAFRVIGAWMMGADESFQTKSYGYFLSSDNSDESLGYVEGCISHNRAMVVAAELVEEIMFFLDKIYHIFPEDITRKEKLWEEEKKSWIL